VNVSGGGDVEGSSNDDKGNSTTNYDNNITDEGVTIFDIKPNYQLNKAQVM
jgi:hypothetical protein